MGTYSIVARDAMSGDLAGGVAAVRRAAEVHPGWLVLLDRLDGGLAPAAEAIRRQLGRT